jgi:hypothetical protein
METPVRLPNVPMSVPALIFGILSIVLCCFFGIGIVFGILALVFAGKGFKAFNENPELYSKGSLGMSKAGKITGIIGLIISSIYFLIWIFLIILGSATGGALFFLEEFMK